MKLVMGAILGKRLPSDPTLGGLHLLAGGMLVFVGEVLAPGVA